MMKQKLNLVFTLFIAVMICSCTSESKKLSSLEKEVFSRDIDSLGIFINLEKYKPINVMWKITPLGDNKTNFTFGPTDYSLQAFIQFDRKTADKLNVDNKSNLISDTKFNIQDFWFKWLPEDLLIKDKASFNYVYKSDVFQKSHFSNGSYIFISVNTILLTLNSN